MPQHDRFEQNGIKHQERSPALSIIIPKISSQKQGCNVCYFCNYYATAERSNKVSEFCGRTMNYTW